MLHGAVTCYGERNDDSLINFFEQNQCVEANSVSVVKEILLFSGKPLVLLHFHKTPPQVPIVCQMNEA
jgi:hypothetical protein